VKPRRLPWAQHVAKIETGNPNRIFDGFILQGKENSKRIIQDRSYYEAGRWM
jgi:hypothetical protein